MPSMNSRASSSACCQPPKVNSAGTRAAKSPEGDADSIGLPPAVGDGDLIADHRAFGGFDKALILAFAIGYYAQSP